MVVLSLLAFLAAGSSDVAVTASFVPPAPKGTPAGVAVRFAPRDPDIRVNEDPAPRLKLDPAQTVLAEGRAVPAKGVAPKPGEVKYLDTTFPVVFPVTWNGEKPPAVKASVTYFYCSKREGWCRKGTADVDIPIGAR